MKDLLEYLNSASVDDLSAITGITRPLAESIIAARPYSSLDDSARVKGFTANELELIRTAFDSTPSDNSSSDVEKSAETVTPQEKPGKRSSVAGILLRVLLALLILGAVFVIIYFGIPWFKEKVLTPLQSNTEGLNQVASQQAANMETLSTQIAVLQGRVATLEARADYVDQSIQAHTEALQKLDELQAALQTGFEDHKVAITSQITEQLALTRAIELLSRSRLYLSQSNFGLAKTDAVAARKLLFSLLSTVSPEQTGALRIVIDRLDLALTNIEAYPAIAVYDLDMAWRLLVDGLPNVPQMSLTPVIEETLPPTAIPQVTATPTLVP